MKRTAMFSLSVFMFLVLAGENAQTARGKHGRMTKVGLALAGLYEEYQAYVVLKGSHKGFKHKNRLLPVISNRVIIDAVAAGDVDALKADLKRLGLKKASVFGRIVSGQLPISAIKGMADSALLKFARPAYAMTREGSVTSQGDAAMRSDIARATGVDGSGITVGVLSDSFDCSRIEEAADVSSGDLPSGIAVLDDTACPETDEGRAMMQLIHDVAPGASQAFHTAFNGQADFASGIVELATIAGADVIVDDVIYFAEPMFQDGIIAQAVKTVVDSGISYFSAAGNDARNAYESSFNPGQNFNAGKFGGSFFGGVAHDFGSGDVFQKITIPAGTTLIISYQWDDPFFSVSGNPGADTDMDIYILDKRARRVLASSAFDNIGGDPVEVFGVVNNGSKALDVNIMLVKFSGSDPGLMKYVRFENGSVTIKEFDTASGSIYGHANAAEAEAVGAAFYGNTPEFGQDPPLLESFSSAGPTKILFDTDGNPIPDVLRQKPEIVGPDCTNTTFFFPGFDLEPDGDPNFCGTSAAAPHAAGVAALMLEADPNLVPADVYAALENTALDMETAGFDFDSGFGFIQADLAVDAVSGPDSTPPTVTINQAGAQADPTNASPINFTVVFSEDVTGFTGSDVTLVGTAGATTAIVTGGPATYNVAVSGMNSDGTVTASINAGVATDDAENGNLASTSTDDTVTFDMTQPTVTIDQAGAQADPTNASPINFTVVFSEDVSGFETGDVTLNGTAGATTAIVTGGPAMFNVAVSGMNSDGTVTVFIAADVVIDAAGNPNLASTSTDDTVTFNAQAATETIEIIKATFNSRKGNMKVEATSSLGGPPDTSLTATFFYGTTELPVGGKAMKYNAKKDKWSVTFDSGDGLTTKPDKVKVSSTNTFVETTNIGGK